MNDSQVLTDTRAQSPLIREVLPAPELPAQRTMTIEERVHDLAERAGHLRSTTTIVGDDATAVHHDVFRIQLDTRTSKLARQNPTVLLDELAALGFAWRDIARMVGVSVPALRRWRSGERPSGGNRRAIAQLLAFAQIIRDDHRVFEPASWMEVPIVSGAPTTAVDLYVAGHLEVVFDLAAEHCTPEVALDTAEPGWSERYRSDWEVGTAEDGQPYIRPKPGR